MNCKKNWLKFLNRFGFISLKLKKSNRTEKPSQNRKKPSQTGLNRFFPKIIEPNWNRSVGTVFFLKKPVWLFFFIKIEPNKK